MFFINKNKNVKLEIANWNIVKKTYVKLESPLYILLLISIKFKEKISQKEMLLITNNKKLKKIFFNKIILLDIFI